MFAVAGIVIGACAAVVLVLVVGRHSSSSSSTPSVSALGQQYASLSDGELRSCPPERVPVDPFIACIGRFDDGLSRLQLPASAAPTVQEMHELDQLLQTCKSEQLHEIVTMRVWPAGCPQQGPATITDADAEDQRFRSDYYARLLADDSQIRQGLGLPTSSAAAATT